MTSFPTPVGIAATPRRVAETIRPSRSGGLRLAELGALPDRLIRLGIRRLLRKRLRGLYAGSWSQRESRKRALIAAMDHSPVAVNTEEANGQHYEVPPTFFGAVLGKHLKYSCGYWPEGVDTLDDAEAAALTLVEQRAQLADGQRILELGCGWGSLTLWMARRFPKSRITAVSNSGPQRQFILARAEREGLDNVEVITADINRFDAETEAFDRVVSIEMFEHTRNWRELLRRVSGWMKPDAMMFLHVFTHRTQPYFFEPEHDDDWMSRVFFTGGLMPSEDLLLNLQDDVIVEDHWIVDGTHYAKTARAWLENQDAHGRELMPLLEHTYGSADTAKLWWQRWRIFWMACEELWAFNGGNEWGVSHYLLRRRA